MKKLLAFVTALLFATAAYGQSAGTVQNHAFAIGKGPGVSGWTSLTCAATQLAVGQAAADPICRTMTGDWTINSAGVAALSTVNVNVGTFGSSTNCLTVTVDGKGRITAVSQTACAPTGITTLTGDVTAGPGSGSQAATLAASGVGAGGPTGSATVAPIITYDAKGRLTAVTSATITPAIGNVTGLGAGCATFLGTPSSANLRGCMTDETGTGLAYFQGGALGTPVSGDATNIINLNATQLTAGTLPTARLNLGQLTNSLGANVALSNIANYFDGPSVAQGVTGTWFASGTVTGNDTAGAANIQCKLWDGTTVISSAQGSVAAANLNVAFALSGFITSPAGNIRISCKDPASTSGNLLFNGTGNSKDSTVSVFRIN